MKKLKVFLTRSGFFEFAVAAESKKAASDLLGIGAQAFQHGLAEETLDPEICAALKAKPATVLQRPVGSKVRFSEHADLPKLPRAKQPSGQKTRDKNTTTQKQSSRQEQNVKKTQQEFVRAREETKRARAMKLFRDAEQRHGRKKDEIDGQMAEIEKKRQAEEERWGLEKKRLLKDI